MCQKDFDEDFNFECPGFKDYRARDIYFGTEWYTVCANPHVNKSQFILVEAGLSLLGILTYRLAFSSKDEKIKFN